MWSHLMRGLACIPLPDIGLMLYSFTRYRSVVVFVVVVVFLSCSILLTCCCYWGITAQYVWRCTGAALHGG